jgi:hypothetical protein
MNGISTIEMAEPKPVVSFSRFTRTRSRRHRDPKGNLCKIPRRTGARTARPRSFCRDFQGGCIRRARRINLNASTLRNIPNAPHALLRKQQQGEYEKTGAEHSWDTYHFFSSYVTFRVGHHSYHHLAVKPY